jgi:hypothetical protein
VTSLLPEPAVAERCVVRPTPAVDVVIEIIVAGTRSRWLTPYGVSG